MLIFDAIPRIEEMKWLTRDLSREVLSRSSAKLTQNAKVNRADVHSMPHLRLIYCLGVGLLIGGYFLLHDTGFSTLLTVSAGIEFFALVVLLINVLFRQSTCGISKKMIILEMMVFFFRLSSTLWLRGYLPADSTGSGLFQLCDAGALLCASGIYTACTHFNTEAQEEMDESFPILTVFSICLVAAILVHPGLNNFAIFDICWTVSVYLNVVSILPQLMMIVKAQEEMDALSSHFVAAVTVSRILNVFFWYHAFEELSPLDGGSNIAGWAILLSLSAQALMMLDFAYYYVKALIFRSKFYRKDGVFC